MDSRVNRVLETMRQRSRELSLKATIKSAITSAECEAQSNGQHYGVVLMPSRAPMGARYIGRGKGKRRLLQEAG